MIFFRRALIFYKNFSLASGIFCTVEIAASLEKLYSNYYFIKKKCFEMAGN